MAFEHALKAWPRFDESRARPGTWLLAISHNVLIDHYRRDRSATQDPIGEEGVGEAVGLRIEGPEQDLGVAPELARALEQLTDREREILALRFGGDLSGPEIARVADLSLANVQQILSRSLRKLRSLLEGELERRVMFGGS